MGITQGALSYSLLKMGCAKLAQLDFGQGF
ncbi:MAG: hypothetical protein BWX68_01176 [Verrucomicrobia bacterium ADurb.Bin063]|nr:MAG: hypothetical protein BWX68_01176 [Verrucomicrobia bacterium ADurb.Bin063]